MEIIHCDFETTVEEYNSERSFISIWGAIDSTNKFIWNIGPDTFMDYLNSIKEISTIYFHNGSRFDFEYLKHLFGEKLIYNESNSLLKGQFNFMAPETAKTISMRYKNKKGVNIYFKDSILFLEKSIEDLPGSTKHKIDKDTFYKRFIEFKNKDEVSDDLVSYLYDDILTQKKNMDSYIKKANVGIRNYTCTSVAFRDLKKKTEYKEKYKNQITIEEWKHFKLWGTGAFTYTNPKFAKQIIKDVHTYDVNGLYTEVMTNTWLPYGEPIYGCGKKCKHITSLLAIEVDIELKEGYIPFLTDTSNYGMHGTIEWKEKIENKTIYVTSLMWDYALEFYNVNYFKIVQKICFESTFGFAHEFFDIQMAIKESADEGSIERLLAKGNMNHCYGRFMMSPEREVFYFEKITKDTKLKKSDIVYGKYFMNKKTELADDIMYIPMGIFILSNARMITLKAVNADPDNFVKSDTDSASFCNDSRIVEKSIIVHQKKTGAWKYEGMAKYMIAIRRKLYFVSDSVDGPINIEASGAAGFKKELALIGMSLNDIIDNKLKAKVLMKRKLPGGVLLVERIKNLKYDWKHTKG